jgi:hypothetical protein
MECNKTNTFISAILLGLTVGLGVLAAGWFVGRGLYLGHLNSRVVTVKGLAERDVKSDLGVWEIDYREIGAAIADVNKRVLHDQELVIAFLKAHGFTDQELEVQPLKLDDKMANAYQDSRNIAPELRFVITSGVRVRSVRVDVIQQVNQLTGTLFDQGVTLTQDSSGVSPNPSYYFTKLDAIRPDMLAEATHSAKLVAAQFAKDAETSLNGIQRASQGVFQLSSRDSGDANGDSMNMLGSIDKKVRLVTTIDYRLK